MLSEEQYRMIDKRREAHLKGESKSFTWEQVKQNVRASNSAIQNANPN